MAGCFEQINNRMDFSREVDRARILCADFLKRKNKSPTLLSVDMQLKFIQDGLKAKRSFSRKERKGIDIGLRMHREYEEIRDDVDFYEFKELILLIDLYMDYRPNDALASDPDNDDKFDWDDV